MNNDRFENAIKRAFNVITPSPDSKIIYLDQVESVADCYNAPYFMCRYPDGTVIMVPKSLINMEHLVASCFKTEKLNNG